MIQVKFKNLLPSELARECVLERLNPLIEKFPELEQSRILVTLEMINSPSQPGPDLFSTKIHVSEGRYSSITITKTSGNLYIALAEVVGAMLERLNRYGDRKRVKQRSTERRWTQKSARASGE